MVIPAESMFQGYYTLVPCIFLIFVSRYGSFKKIKIDERHGIGPLTESRLFYFKFKFVDIISQVVYDTTMG